MCSETSLVSVLALGGLQDDEAKILAISPEGHLNVPILGMSDELMV